MAEPNYTLKVTRTEINELAVSLAERKEKLEKEWFALQTVAVEVTEEQRKELEAHLNAVANLQLRIG